MEPVRHLRLSELNRKINEVLHGSFNTIEFWVIADITNHSFKSDKNYHNFELVEKDPDSNDIIAKINGKAWGKGTLRIENFEKITGQKFTNNINVLLNISVKFHTVFGLQVEINDVDPNFTLGVLEQQRQSTLERLVQENPSFILKSGGRYITRNNQLRLNKVLQKIAVISSSNSAGAEDFRHTLLDNTAGYKFHIDNYYTAVQGEINADEFLKKIIEVFQSKQAYDAVIITRGGGSQTDFLIFDNYYIGRALAKFPIPVITGIGHHKNETIADLMVHTQTKTPTKAAEFIIAHNRDFEEAMLSFQKGILIRTQQLFSIHFQALASYSSIVVNQSRDLLSEHKERLAHINQITTNVSSAIIYKNGIRLIAMTSQLVSQPRILLNNLMNNVNRMTENLKTSPVHYLRNQQGSLEHYRSVIKLMSPENILRKGFAIVRIKNRVISNPDEISIGEEMEVILSDTKIQSTVTHKSTYEGTDFKL